MLVTLFVFIFALFPLAVLHAAEGDIIITEIMYDLPDADGMREWVEIYNSGAGPVTVIGGSGNNTWRLHEIHSSGPHNHTFGAEPSQGSMTLSSGQYAVIAQNGEAFLADNPNFSKTILISSAFSLTNTSQTLGLRIGSSGTVWSGVNYASELGAQGDGKSLQLIGSQWVAASSTPGAFNSIETTPSPSSSEEGVSAPPSASGASVTTQSKITIVFPSIKANSGGNRTAVAGSLIEFKGNALGLKDDPLDNARFWWNLGDGNSIEGRSILHTFRIPGTYTVGLHVSSGEYAASDYITVSVIPNQLRVADVILLEDGYIKLVNKEKTEIDLGGWILEDSSGKTFTIPVKTKIGPQAEIALLNSVTSLFKFVDSSRAIIRYPNGREAVRWSVDAKSLVSDIGTTVSPRVLTDDVNVKDRVSDIGEEDPAAAPELVPKLGSEQAAVAASGISSKLFFLLAAVFSVLASVGFFLVKKKYF